MRTNRQAFTLVELMVATAVLTLLLVILLQMTNSTAATWRNGAAKAEQFQEARKAFDTMTQRISEATLNTYWDYSPPLNNLNINNAFATNVIPTMVRQSELRFRVVNMPANGINQGSGDAQPYYPPSQGVFFQAPLGIAASTQYLYTMDNLLNSWGYFIEVFNTKNSVPKFLSSSYPNRYRARLMEMQEATEYNTIFTQDLPAKKSPLDPYARTKDPLLAIGASANAAVPSTDDVWFTAPLNLPVLALTAGTNTGIGAQTVRPTHVLAENIVALVILPKLTPQDDAARKADPTVSANISAFPVLSQNYTYHSKQTSNYAPGGPTKPDPYINPKNQLPPIVQVAMFAIDEQSAQKLVRANPAPNLNLSTLYQGTTGQLFTDSTQLEMHNSTPGGDLLDFENNLLKQKLTYRLFTTNISIHGAKWSRSQSQ